MKLKRQSGFTLVELATVLVIIGLILGMAFKGKDLIDSARVRSAQASSNKILAAMNTYFERYGRYPGDGCNGADDMPDECTQTADGRISNAEEGFFFTLLTNTNMLPASERHTPFGSDWTVDEGGAGGSNTLANVLYLTVGGVNGSNVDVRYVCAMDNQYDDGNPTTGNIRSTASNGSGDTQYQANADCWTSKSGSVSLAIRLLP
ncbi:type II secretion system protein [Chitinibacteraceae bacterium HSL-7]